MDEEEVDHAGDGRAKDAPGRLVEGGVDAGDDVDEAVEDNQAVEARSLLPQDADARPQVDHKAYKCERNVCKKVNLRFHQIHLDRGL